jgi:hypothetical protein
MNDFGHIALVLSIVSALLGFLGALLGARIVRLRISAEKELTRKVFLLYQKKNRIGEFATIVERLDAAKYREFDNDKNFEVYFGHVNDKDFEVYIGHVEEAVRTLENKQRRVIESAITQRSQKGRVRFLEKLAREIGNLSHV